MSGTLPSSTLRSARSAEAPAPIQPLQQGLKQPLHAIRMRWRLTKLHRRSDSAAASMAFASTAAMQATSPPSVPPKCSLVRAFPPLQHLVQAPPLPAHPPLKRQLCLLSEMPPGELVRHPVHPQLLLVHPLHQNCTPQKRQRWPPSCVGIGRRHRALRLAETRRIFKAVSAGSHAAGDG